ncbi:MAG TPA: carbamoyltransferase C-terminal domain-containing protein [Bryobacteraceae bacterium]|nr:carbamoyltransferase C-terminal domain-containing protein [Bryobacteraceae bacterium]
MNILGIGGVLGNAAAALLLDGELVAAVEEIRVARRHLPGEMPDAAITACLRDGRIGASDIDCLAIARPLREGPQTGFHLELRARFPRARVLVVDHHAAHAASAWYPSPFTEGTVLTLDRVGDFRCGARWRAEGNDLDLQEELYYPDSLGDLYGRVTELLGFAAGHDEHKVQWLSAWGDDRFVPLFTEIIGEGAWPALDQTWFDRDRLSHGGFSSRLYERIGLGDGQSASDALKPHIAAGVQRAIEAAVMRMAGVGRNVCLAGGLAMNVMLIAALERDHSVFVQPAAGNAGTALGAALHAWHNMYQQRTRVPIGDLCLGPGYSAEEIKQVLENCKLRFRYLLTMGELIDTAVQQLSENRIVAWMQGRMEFGPRALGNRSILASPLDPYSSENLNLFIKHREPFRKFAASVPEESAAEYFEIGPNARYLATVGRVKPAHRKRFETAVLGRDMVRVHTVRREDNPLYYQLLLAAGKRTGLPVLYNTSFNLFNDPLVCSPRDAVRGFYSSGIDAMFVGNFLLEK